MHGISHGIKNSVNSREKKHKVSRLRVMNLMNILQNVTDVERERTEQNRAQEIKLNEADQHLTEQITVKQDSSLIYTVSYYEV